MIDKPALRTDIQIVMTHVEGRRMIVFQDPYNLSDQQIAVGCQAWPSSPASVPGRRLVDGRPDDRPVRARREAKEERNTARENGKRGSRSGLAPPDSVERSGAGVEPTQPRVTRPHRS